MTSIHLLKSFWITPIHRGSWSVEWRPGYTFKGEIKASIRTIEIVWQSLCFLGNRNEKQQNKTWAPSVRLATSCRNAKRSVHCRKKDLGEERRGLGQVLVRISLNMSSSWWNVSTGLVFWLFPINRMHMSNFRVSSSKTWDSINDSLLLELKWLQL